MCHRLTGAEPGEWEAEAEGWAEWEAEVEWEAETEAEGLAEAEAEGWVGEVEAPLEYGWPVESLASWPRLRP